MDTLNSQVLTIDNQEFTAESIEKIALLDKLLSIGTALSSSRDLLELLTLILTKSREITLSDAGSVFFN